MARTVKISDDLADLLEERRKRGGFPSLDATAEAVLTYGLVAGDDNADHSAGRSDDELRALIAEAEASGPAVTWDAVAVRTEVLRRYASRRGEP
jgi:hypothetical protein